MLATSTKRIITMLFIVLFALPSFVFGGGARHSRTVTAYAAGSAEIVMEATTNRVLGGSNIHARLPMASTTKAMTALVVIESCNLDSKVTIPKAAVGIEGSSIYLREGEKLTVKELLYGLMLRSGNDAATALAIHTGGSLDGFVKMMNDKAAAMGLKNTHFTNPHGLHNANHYTSAYDLAIISSAGITNPVFREICSTKRIRISGDSEESIRDLYNKNKILTLYNGGNGIKTGFTKNAGRCLVASSARDGMQVVSVVLNRGDMFEQCMRLMDYAHATYCMSKVVDKSQPIASAIVANGKIGDRYISKAPLYATQDNYYPLKKDGSESVQSSISVPNTIQAPHKKQDSAGEIQITFDNHLIFSQKLYTMDNIEKKDFKDKLKDFFGINKQRAV